MRGLIPRQLPGPPPGPPSGPGPGPGGANDRHRTAVWLVALALLFSVATACSSDNQDGSDDAADSVVSTTESDTGDDPADSVVPPSDSDTEDGSDIEDGSDTEDGSDSEDGSSPELPGVVDDVRLPGQPWSGFAELGDELAVVGVSSGDVLNVRSVPGENGPIVATVDPDGTVLANGSGRILPRSLWYEVEVAGIVGWASISYLAFQGPVDDATAEYVASDGPQSAETMTELGRLVAEAFASTEPESDIVQVSDVDEGSDSRLAEVEFDVIGLGDDAVAGYRLHLFANPDADEFSIKSIERTTFCTRGISEGRCA